MTNDAGEQLLSVEATLNQRGNRYGKFSTHASITQSLKRVLIDAGMRQKCSASQIEALEMICHKMGRIVNGDPNYDDSWRDIAGYAQLVVDELNEKEAA